MEKENILLLPGKTEEVWQVPEAAEKTERQGRIIKRASAVRMPMKRGHQPAAILNIYSSFGRGGDYLYKPFSIRIGT